MSQQWLVDAYEGFGVEIDRMFAWELESHDPASVFNSVPPHLIPK